MSHGKFRSNGYASSDGRPVGYELFDPGNLSKLLAPLASVKESAIVAARRIWFGWSFRQVSKRDDPEVQWSLWWLALNGIVLLGAALGCLLWTT